MEEADFPCKLVSRLKKQHTRYTGRQEEEVNDRRQEEKLCKKQFRYPGYV